MTPTQDNKTRRQAPGLRPNGQKKPPAQGRMEVPYLLQANAEEEHQMIDTPGWQQHLAQYKGCEICAKILHTDAFHTDALARQLKVSSPIASAMLCDYWEQHKREAHPKPRSHIGNGKPVGPFAFTLTKSPKDPLSISDLLAAARGIMAQKTKPVLKYAWYYEDKGRDSNGDPLHPHIHGMYETVDGGRIPARQFERNWKIWDETSTMGAGFLGGYHRPVKYEEAYSDYICKDGGLGESKGL